MIDKFNKQRSATPPLPSPWRRAIQRMDDALEQNAPTDNSEKIEMLGRQLFGKLWRHRKPDSND